MSMFKVRDNGKVIYGNLHTRAGALEYIEECIQEDISECDNQFHSYSIEEYGINFKEAGKRCLCVGMVSEVKYE